MNAVIRESVDACFPGFSATFRRLRDSVWFRKLRIVETNLGLKFFAGPGLVAAVESSSEIPVLKRLCSNADAYVDVGAHLGLYTCIAAQSGKPVIAIEPHPLNIKLLCRNVRLNRLESVEIFPVALTDQAGVVTLYGGQQGGSLHKGWSGIRSNYETLTPANTIDNILAGRFENQRLVIKVDCEGNELSILNGGTRTLSREPRPVWMMEVGLTENFAGIVNPDFRAIFELMWSHGYLASPMNALGRVVDSDDVIRWLEQRATDHGDINYLFYPLGWPIQEHVNGST
jgi:FkbM family methyltransferase